MKNILTLNLLRSVALVVVLVAAAASVGFTLHAGRHNPSILLRVLFVSWVLSPFIALLIASIIFKRWPSLARTTLFWLMIVLAFGSVVGYSGAFSPPDAKPAAIFLTIPFISWLLMAIVLPIALSISKRKLRRGDSL